MASPHPGFSPKQAEDLLDHLVTQMRRTLRHPDADRIHDLRVAIRRFNQALAVLKPCLVAAGVKEIKKELKAMMSPAGEARNCDVTVKLLKNAEQPLPRQITRIRRQKQNEMISAIRTSLDQNAAERWRAELGACESLTAADARRMIRQSIAKSANRVHKRAKEIHTSMDALHKLRIATKKLRYTLELAGAPSEAVEQLQTQLGDINDYRAARRLLKQIPGTAQARETFAKRQRKKVRRFRRDFKEPQPAR